MRGTEGQLGSDVGKWVSSCLAIAADKHVQESELMSAYFKTWWEIADTHRLGCKRAASRKPGVDLHDTVTWRAAQETPNMNMLSQ